MSDYKVNVSSSFVASSFKLKDDTGSGEAKLFFGPMRKETEFDTYFDFTGATTYKLDKDNLLEYLKAIKIEYMYQCINQYKRVGLREWENAYNYVEGRTDFEIDLEKFTDASRYYIRAVNSTHTDSEEIFEQCLRKLPLPVLSHIEFEKDTATNEIKILLSIDYGTGVTNRFVYDTTYSNDDYELNRIVFGAPGTGKSFLLEEDAQVLITDPACFERVTFYPDYTFSRFVGTYKPVTVRGNIVYKFVPGPFMRILVKALQESMKAEPKPCLLIIEEINRANAAAAFGDIFQLLDRNDRGYSEYAMFASEDVQNYLAEVFNGRPSEYREIRIPNNMFIWATMNSADQGVFPIDTAFKRRWDYEYIGIDAKQPTVSGTVTVGTTKAETVEWQKLRRAINNKLLDDCKVNEDKLLGPFFIGSKLVEPSSATVSTVADEVAFREVFKSKILMYLFEDAGKQHRKKLFEGCDSRKYSSVCDAFDVDGIYIFGDKFKTDYYDLA